jgi:hypothetical protein
MKAFKECPQFEKCSVNDCPLDMDERANTLHDDPETKCRAQKSVRMSIAEKYNLQNRGLTYKELSSERKSKQAKKRWKALSEEEKQKRLCNLRNNV